MKDKELRQRFADELEDLRNRLANLKDDISNWREDERHTIQARVNTGY